MFIYILLGVTTGYIIGRIHKERYIMKKQHIRILMAVVGLAIIGFFGFKAFTKSAEASEPETEYSSEPRAQEPITMKPESILSCLRWIKGDDNKNYCVIGG